MNASWALTAYTGDLRRDLEIYRVARTEGRAGRGKGRRALSLIRQNRDYSKLRVIARFRPRFHGPLLAVVLLTFRHEH
jgi:hypothetical protein